jgi:hypothetical protein
MQMSLTRPARPSQQDRHLSKQTTCCIKHITIVSYRLVYSKYRVTQCMTVKGYVHMKHCYKTRLLQTLIRDFRRHLSVLKTECEVEALQQVELQL